MDKMKRCNICGIEQDLKNFYKNKKAKDGVQSKCKSCSSLYAKKYNSENNLYERYKESHKIANKKWMDSKGKEWFRNYFKVYFKTYTQKPRIRNLELARVHSRRYRSTAHGKAVDRYNTHKRRCRLKNGSVTTSELKFLIEQSPNCFYCSKPLNGTYHMDHYIPLARGGSHTIDNIVISCPKCNLSKGKKLPNEFTPCQWTK